MYVQESHVDFEVRLFMFRKLCKSLFEADDGSKDVTTCEKMSWTDLYRKTGQLRVRGIRTITNTTKQECELRESLCGKGLDPQRRGILMLRPVIVDD